MYGKKTLLYYIVFIIGVAFARGYSAYGLELSVPLVGPSGHVIELGN